jgi:hypothetical protein
MIARCRKVLRGKYRSPRLQIAEIRRPACSMWDMKYKER